MKRNWSEPASTTPLPMNVVITCRPVSSQKARSACEAPWRTTPLPARITGISAVCSSSAARSRLTGSASTIGCGARGSGRPDDAPRHHVLGELEVGRAGLLGDGRGEGLAHRLADHARVVHARVPLGHRAQHVDGVDELVRLLVHAGEGDLPGQRHQGRLVERGVADAGGQVGGAGTERREAHAGLAGEAPVGVGHERGALLVTHRHERDLLGVIQRLAEVQRLLAGDAEDVLGALGLEALDEELRGEARRLIGRFAREDGLGLADHDPECTSGFSRGATAAPRAAPLWPRRRWRTRRGRGTPARARPAGTRPRGRSCRRCRCRG